MIWYVFIPSTVMYMLQLIFVFLLFLDMVCMLMNFKQMKTKIYWNKKLTATYTFVGHWTSIFAGDKRSLQS